MLGGRGDDGTRQLGLYYYQESPPPLCFTWVGMAIKKCFMRLALRTRQEVAAERRAPTPPSPQTCCRSHGRSGGVMDIGRTAKDGRRRTDCGDERHSPSVGRSVAVGPDGMNDFQR